MIKKLHKTGNSRYIILNRVIREMMGFDEYIEMVIEKGWIKIRPAKDSDIKEYQKLEDKRIRKQ